MVLSGQDTRVQEHLDIGGRRRGKIVPIMLMISKRGNHKSYMIDKDDVEDGHQYHNQPEHCLRLAHLPCLPPHATIPPVMIN